MSTQRLVCRVKTLPMIRKRSFLSKIGACSGIAVSTSQNPTASLLLHQILYRPTRPTLSTYLLLKLTALDRL